MVATQFISLARRAVVITIALALTAVAVVLSTSGARSPATGSLMCPASATAKTLPVGPVHKPTCPVLAPVPR